jgi:hypothetical protein
MLISRIRAPSAGLRVSRVSASLGAGSAFHAVRNETPVTVQDASHGKHIGDRLSVEYAGPTIAGPPSTLLGFPGRPGWNTAEDPALPQQITQRFVPLRYPSGLHHSTTPPPVSHRPKKATVEAVREAIYAACGITALCRI